MPYKFNPNLAHLIKRIGHARIFLLQGGTRSGKTYSSLLFIIRLCLQSKGLLIEIARKTMPALKASVLYDFKEIMQLHGYWSEDDWNSTDKIYTFEGNEIRFVNLDDEQKVRGRKRHLIYINEANENDWPIIQQLLVRTSGKIIMDYNPSFDWGTHWLSDVAKRADCERIVTTYKDNPHLPKALIEEIELYRHDSDWWRAFGEGIEGEGIKGLIFPKWQIGWEAVKQRAFGLDFGFSQDPTALVEVGISGSNMFMKEHIYSKGLTIPDLAMLIKHVGTAPIYADSAQPAMIEELRRKGFNIIPAEKGAGSIKHGIETIKRFSLYAEKDSVNLHKELRSYKWLEDRQGNSLNEPVGYLNHAIDAIRYAVAGLVRNPSTRAESVAGIRAKTPK
jgi:phage terminase large subunit